jgi:group I intron endonuclease
MKIATEINGESGVYIIRNTVSGKRYVGSAVHLRKRIVNHRSDLSRGKHHNKPLTMAWEKYGPIAFVAELLEYCQKDRLYEVEQKWIDALKPEYNAKPNAEPGWLGMKMPAEAVEKMRASLTGRKLSQEHRKNIGDATRGIPRPIAVVERAALKRRESIQARIASGRPGLVITKRRKDKKLSAKQAEELKGKWVPRGRGGKAPMRGPSIKQLAMEYGVSYPVARKAIFGIGENTCA